MINDSVLLRFRARAPEDVSAIEVIYLLIKIIIIIVRVVLSVKVTIYANHNTSS